MSFFQLPHQRNSMYAIPVDIALMICLGMHNFPSHLYCMEWCLSSKISYFLKDIQMSSSERLILAGPYVRCSDRATNRSSVDFVLSRSPSLTQYALFMFSMHHARTARKIIVNGQGLVPASVGVFEQFFSFYTLLLYSCDTAVCF